MNLCTFCNKEKWFNDMLQMASTHHMIICLYFHFKIDFQSSILVNFALHCITLSFCHAIIVPFILIIRFFKSTLIISSFSDPILVIT